MTSARKSKGKKEKKEMSEDEEMLTKEPKGSFAWKRFMPSQIRRLACCETPEDLEVLKVHFDKTFLDIANKNEKMAAALNMDHYEVDLREAAQVDYFVAAFHWAKEKSFDDRQLGGFMALLSDLMENVKTQKMSKQENFKLLKESFVGVGLDNPEQIPISLYFFTLDQAKDMMSYLVSTLFQHYVLYNYLFTQEQDELIIGSDLLAEVCPETEGTFPPPLEEAMTEEVFEKFAVQPKPDTAEEKPQEETEAHISDELAEAVLKAVESSSDEAVKQVSTAELRRVIEKVTKDLILPKKKELSEKIKEKETAYLAKIGKVQTK